MKKHHFTLAIPEELIRQIKIQAINENRSVSEITAELYTDYLKRAAKTAAKKEGK